MSESVLQKKWLPLALVLGCLALGAAGWFGYSLWTAAAKAQAGWRTANEDMRELLLEQSDTGGTAKAKAQGTDKSASAAKSKEGDASAPDSSRASGSVEASKAASAKSTAPAGQQPAADPGGSTAAASSGSAVPNEAGAASSTASAGAAQADDNTAAAAAGAAPPKSTAAPAAQGASQAGGKINLNTATADQLTSIPGIGDSKAKAILDYREQHGGHFQTIDQLLEVKGIGDKLLAKMRPYVAVGP